MSRVVYVKGDILTTNKSEDTAKWEILELWERIPIKSYKVTYILDNRGHFLVTKKNIMVINCIGGRHKGCMRHRCPKHGLEIGVCFLPKTWDGKRVRRELSAIVYENDGDSVVIDSE